MTAATLDTTPTALECDPLAEEIVRLGESAARSVDQLERGRELPDELHNRAAEVGLFRQLVPESLGGRGETPLRWFRRGMVLAQHEPSIAWVVTQGAAELGWIGAGGDEAWARHVLADPLASSASTIAGSGTLHVEDGTATLSGTWAFDTGCRHATWVGGLAVVDGLELEPGALPMRMCWVPANRAHVLDDWDSTGMRGTGSHSIVIPEQDIDLGWTVDLFRPTTNHRGPHSCLVGNGNWPIATSVAATQLGNARRALDECRDLVQTKAPPPDFTPLVKSPAVQQRLCELEGEWMAAVAVVERELEQMWADARRLGALDAHRRWRLATANANANRVAVRVVDGACSLTGTAVASRSGPLGRALRDAHTLRGHISTSAAVTERAAQVSLGLIEPDLMV